MTDSIVKRLAPSVDPDWAEAMVLELRIQGVAGDRIGEALSEVESHCAESGRTAADVFGEPEDYARTLSLPTDAGQQPAAIGRAVAPIVVQVLGMLAVLSAVPALRPGGTVELRLGQLVWALVFLAATAVLVLAAVPLLRVATRRPVVATIGAVALVALLVVPPLLLPGVIAELTAWPVLLVGVAAIGAGVTWALVQGRHAADEIGSPVPGAETPTSRVPWWLQHLLVPVATLVGILLEQFLG